MAELPVEVLGPTELADWFEMTRKLAELKQKEHFARERIFRIIFKEAKEGTNTYVLPDKYQIKGIKVINRKVVEEQLQALSTRPAIEGGFGPSALETQGIRVDELIKWEPGLVVKKYRELTEEQRVFFDQILLIGEGSPQMKIEPPAKPRGKVKPDEVQEEKGPQA